MEEYLRRVQQCRLGAQGDPVHAVLGGPRPDVDTVAATLSLALHLNQKEASGGLCVPVLCGRRGNNILPAETLTYLQRVNICQSLLLWREDVDLGTLHHTGKLSLTLLRDGLLDSSEYHVLKSSVLRVVHHDGQQDTGDDGASFAVTTVAREIRQEAAEHIRAALGKTLGEALRLHCEAVWIQHGRPSTQLEELRKSLEPSDAIATQLDEAMLQYLEQLLTTELKEYSDGETTIALSSITSDTELWPVNVVALKSFCHHHNLNGLVLLFSSNDTVTPFGQQVAVYSSNTGLLKQMCCELESSCWSLSGELEPQENLQVYEIPMTSSATRPLLEEEIQTALKDFVDQRRTVLARHSSRRTSSTEGVAGSVEFSQGSSGINDMYSSDMDRPEGGSANVVAIARVMADGGGDAGAVGVNTDQELVSPDSGMTTIRSSRSSKESSVFLSDDSPVGEVTAGGAPAAAVATAAGANGLFLRNTSPLGVSSLSPPVPPERRKHRPGRNKSDTIDLLGFDPLQCSDLCLPAGEDPSLSEGRGDGGISSNMSELEELTSLNFSSESRNFSTDQHDEILGSEPDTVVPPTPVNSLVGSRPPSRTGVRFFPEDVVERINSLQHKDSVSSSLSETWDELCFDSQGGQTSCDNRTKDNHSPKNIVENVDGKELITERESWEETLRSEKTHRRPKSLEPQLSLVTGHTEPYDYWNPDSALKESWNTVSLSDLQLTPPDEEENGKCGTGIIGVEEKTMSMSRKKAIVNTLTPDTSKEDDDGVQGKKEDRKTELLDFWTYSAQKGFLKSDSGTTTSYPESLDMWNMTIRDDSLSPLTTPDNFSENSGSFCGVNPNLVGGASVESPPGFSDGGMVMWNTTIQEDTGSSTVTSPEGPDNGKQLSHTGSLDAGDSPESHAGREPEDDKALGAGSDLKNIINPTPKEVGCGGIEHNVRIVIDAAEAKTLKEEMEEDDMQVVWQNVASEASERKTLPPKDTHVWDLPVPGMVTSNSEYDNIGGGGWSHVSSPETCASPVVDMIQLEEQSSPFIAVTNPIQTDETPDVSIGSHLRGSTDSRTVTSNKQKPDNQVFLFEGTSGSSIESEYDNKGHRSSRDVDWTEQPSEHSPFVMVDSSSASQHISDSHHSSPGEAAETQIQTNQYLYPSQVSWDGSDVAHGDDETATDTQQESNKESIGIRITESMSLSSSAGGKRDTLKCSPDSLQPGSRDEARSNSDGDSSSGLEMEYIVVSGKVKEAEREWHDRPKPGDKQTKGVKKAMETFSTLYYAASVLQSHVQGARREQQKEPSTQNQMTANNQAALPSQHHTNPDDTTVCHVVPEMISPSQSQNVSKTFCQSHSGPKGGGQTQVDEGNYDDKSSTVARSVSPSLRYPSDNFLKAREEVYVRSQISMEDSDEGGQSPSAPPPCPTSLGDFHDWGGQLVRQDIPQAPASEIQSPVLTNSSVSHPTSSAGTPLSESGTDRGLGLPFSGDLMEEENDEEGEEAEAGDMRHPIKWTAAVQADREDNQQLASCDLLSFTEELVSASSTQQTVEQKHGRFTQDTGDYYDGQSVRTTEGEERQQTGGHEASCDEYSSVSRSHDVATQPTNENAAYQWTGSHNATQGQTQYGYNYHHIDQRTDNHTVHSACMQAKASSQENATAVYAEFTSDASHPQCGSEQSDSYYGAGPDAEYSPDVSKLQNQYGGDSSQHECSRYETVQYQTRGQPLYHSDVHPEGEDHARYVPEGYVHFLRPSRHSQQRDSVAGMMMMKMASSEEAAEDPDNREDPASSADVSGSSNQRRKLAAPPLSVSLDHSEGSLLSEDALDTEDEALDTGDDLDINIDELDTPDEADSMELNRHGESEESNLSAGAASGDVTDGHGSADGNRDERLWRSVVIGEQEHRIDMKSIEPYKRVISHGGYYTEHNAIIVFAACFLPDSACDNYNYVMENLFLYVISTLELMVAEDYMIVYLNGATPRRRMPGFSWMKKCYQMIDRRLKKNLKMFIIVHPSWFIRTLLGITRPFISSKFSSKIKYVHSLRELGTIIPMEYVHIPPSIIKYDEERGRFACMRLNTEFQEAAAMADKRGNSAV